MTSSPILTIQETAEWLRLDDDYPEMADAIRAVYKLVREGRLEPIRGVGKRYRFSVGELERFVAHEDDQRRSKPLADGADAAAGGDSRQVADQIADKGGT